uniref:ZP domain-containing protein n=1 Tax=Caenorhabditis tropicalis TaxID=1561998 RepID=A0A1I7SXW9_9PELO
MLHLLSTPGSAFDGSSPVPTYPGQISLTLEPLVFRRTGFSPVFRYSCLHSHSCGIHDWITPPLHSPHDALLPIHTAEPRRLASVRMPQLRWRA